MNREILFLAHRLPYPPDRGDRIRSWQMLNALAAIAPVHVITPLDSIDDRQHLAMVAGVAASVTTAPHRSRRSAVLRALVSGLPASVELFSVPALHEAVLKRIATGSIGTVFAFSGQMAHYVPDDLAARFVMDFVDVDSAKFTSDAAAASGLARLALGREAKHLAAFEIATARRADATLFVSEAERNLFSSYANTDAQVIENGVDNEYFSPSSVLPVAGSRPLIVFTGQMDYAPNVEAVVGFVDDVMPLLPGVTFAIVGRSPTAAVRALATERVIVTGEVADTRPWLAAADVVVAPLKRARGVQNKVLEAMAMAKPVVASSAAAEGIDARRGEELIVADSAKAQADAVAGLLADPDHAKSIAAAARQRVINRYSWEECLMPLRALVTG